MIVISTIFFMIFINRNNAAKIESLNTRLKLWSNVSYHVTQAGDEVFNELPIGVLVYDENFIVKWANEYSKRVFNSTLVELSLSVISEDLLKDVTDGQHSMLLNFSDKNYDVVHNVENNVLYFFDVTKDDEVDASTITINYFISTIPLLSSIFIYASIKIYPYFIHWRHLKIFLLIDEKRNLS